MKEKNGEHPYGDTGQLILLTVFLIVWVGDSFVLHKSTWLVKYVPLFIRWAILGLALIASVCLIKSGHIVVSHDRRPDKLIVTGAFRYVRHPLYLASLLTYLGLAVSTMSLVSVMLFLAITYFYNYIANFEENLLEAKFGEEYRKYRKKTGKWVPKLDKES